MSVFGDIAFFKILKQPKNQCLLNFTLILTFGVLISNHKIDKRQFLFSKFQSIVRLSSLAYFCHSIFVSLFAEFSHVGMLYVNSRKKFVWSKKFFFNKMSAHFQNFHYYYFSKIFTYCIYMHISQVVIQLFFVQSYVTFLFRNVDNKCQSLKAK